MSKVTKKELKKQIDDVQNRFAALVKDLKASGHICESVYAPFAHECQKAQSDYDALIAISDSKEPQLKQLDQSVFDGLDEKWKSAATNTDGKAYLHNMPDDMMYFNHSSYGWCSKDYDAHEMQLIGDGFDPSGFAVGFIERDDVAKELLEVDLSSELTGSEYFYSNMTSALLESGSKLVVCFVSDISELKALSNKRIEVITSLDTSFNDSDGYGWQYAIPINNQGEPLTAAEAGL